MNIRARNMRALICILVAIAILLVGSVVLFDNIKVDDVEGFRLLSSTNSTQVIKWDNAKHVTHYEVYAALGSEEEGAFKPVATVRASDALQYVAEDLEVSTLYSYRVVAVNEFMGKEYKSDAACLSAYTSPNAVEGFSAATLSKNSLTAHWEDLQNPAGFEILYGQKKDWSDKQVAAFTADQVTADHENGTLSFTIPELPEGNTYYMSMRCYIEHDGVKSFSEWSDVISARVTRAVDMTGIDLNKPMIALTFDDGPAYGSSTDDILNTLKKYNAKATFFQLGANALGNPENMKRKVNEGHEIGNHTYDHSNYGAAVTRDDIIKASDAIEQACGVRPTCFRSTGGYTTDLIREVCKEEGIAIYYWGVDTRDWESRDADSIYQSILSNAQDGSIILMHDIYGSTAEAVERAIPQLVSQGYQLVTVSQLVQAKSGAPAQPGMQYYSGTLCD